MRTMYLLSFEELHGAAPCRDQVGTNQESSKNQMGVQLPTQLPTQLDKITFYKQVTEQVAFSNHREHQDFAAEVGSRMASQLAAQGGVE